MTVKNIALLILNFLLSLILLIFFSPLIFIIGVMIKLSSKGPIFFKQKRVTQYGREFYIFKFRTMRVGSELAGQLTCKNDSRITKVGKFLRKYRLDEIPQLINVLIGDMTFVGPRPEVPKYVNAYTDEMKKTLQVKAGITSMASIMFRDEDKYLENADDVDFVYINEILPIKMKYNLEYLEHRSIFLDIKIMILTFLKVFKIMR